MSSYRPVSNALALYPARDTAVQAVANVANSASQNVDAQWTGSNPLAQRSSVPSTSPSSGAWNTAPIGQFGDRSQTGMSALVGFVAAGSINAGNMTLACDATSAPSPASTTGTAQAISVVVLADGSLRYLGDYLGSAPQLQGYAMMEYRKSVTARAGAAAAVGHAAFAVGAFVKVSLKKETVFQTIMPRKRAAALMRQEARGGGWFKHRLEAVGAREAPLQLPEPNQPQAWAPGDTLIDHVEGMITGGLVMGNMAQRAGLYCSIEGDFQRVARRCLDGRMEVMFTPQRIVKVGALVGMPLVEQFDWSRKTLQAYSLCYRYDVQNPRALEAFRANYRGALPVPPAPGGPLADGVELAWVEVVDQTVEHIGGGLLAPIVMPSRMHIAGLGFSSDDLRDRRSLTDGYTLVTSETTAHRSIRSRLTRGDLSKVVYVNAQMVTCGDPAVNPPAFHSLLMGACCGVNRIHSDNRNQLVSDINFAFNLTLANFPRCDDDGGYTIAFERPMGIGDLQRLAQFAQQKTEVEAWAGRVGLDTQHLLNILAEIQSRFGMAQSNPEAAIAAGPKVLEDNVKGLRTLGALCRLLDSDKPRLTVTLSCDAYDASLATAQEVNLMYGDPISPGDAPSDVAIRLQKVAAARDKLHMAMRLLSGDVVRAEFLPETLPSFESAFLDAVIKVEAAASFEHLPAAARLLFYRDDEVWKELCTTQKADALCVLRTTATHSQKEMDKRLQALMHGLQLEISAMRSAQDLPETLQQASLEELNAARDKLVTAFGLAAPPARAALLPAAAQD